MSLPGARGETIRNKQEVGDTRPAENNRDIAIKKFANRWRAHCFLNETKTGGFSA